MTAIKIISNPYLQEIKFQKQEDDLWEDINIVTDPKSQLLNDDIRDGFFPFVVQQIVDIICKEYASEDEPVDLVFEGTGDEYKELETVCAEEVYFPQIVLHKSPKYLENARFILPEIREIYKEVEPLINRSDLDQTDLIKEEISKFIDASSDQIPICVFGNYSTGKSTFINALIGCELLPSGDEPITGKIFKISNSKRADFAIISFTTPNDVVELRIEDNDFKFKKGQMASDLNKRIYDEMDAAREESIIKRVRRILDLIQDYTKDNSESDISDIIELVIPFGMGLLGDPHNNFVIFDTPGSNTASYSNHVVVLKKAIEKMSNGIPLFLSEYKALDSTDNEKLYTDIKTMNELDSRFTMIIVNKADEADLEEEEGRVGLTKNKEKTLLRFAVPRNMYGEGLFFVSSIIGLGAKIDGQFSGKHYMRVYSRIKPEYSDPDNPLYQRLYRYNLMPEQLKRRSIEKAEKQSNVLYANSGLLSVEDEIQAFGDKYSSYNKCYQSEIFLRKVIDITVNTIQKKKEDRERSKELRISHLEKDKKALVETIESTNKEKLLAFEEQYPGTITPIADELISSFLEDDLNDDKQEYIKVQEHDLKIEDFERDSGQAIEDIFDHVKSGLKSAIDRKNILQLKEVGATLVSDVHKALDEHGELEVKRVEVIQKADEMVVEKKNADFAINSLRAIEVLYEKSKQYWDQRSVEIRTLLSEVVTGSSALSIEKREKLAEKIIAYQNVEYFVRDEIVDQKKFEKDFFMRKLSLWDTGELNLRKLKNYYNLAIEESIRASYESVNESHRQSYEKWIEDLETVIVENIVDYNPELHIQNEVIKDDTRAIQALEACQKQLGIYKQEISNKMEWKA